MRPDWFTLAAQIVNFLVLVWLLKHFLYDRIVAAMKAREAGIAARLDEAARQREQAEREAELYRARNRELEEQRRELLARAEEEAQEHRRTLMEAARQDMEAARADWLADLDREREELMRDFREQLGVEVIALARQVLREIADADLEEQALRMFVAQLEALEPERREAMLAAIREADGVVEIRTALPLSREQRDRLASRLRQVLDEGIEPRFASAAELICGIELRTHSHRFVWNADSRLETLEASLLELLSGKADAQPS